MKLFKWLGFLFLIFIAPHSLKAEETDQSISYHVKRSDYLFSTVFDMTNDKNSIGSVVKSIFNIGKRYDSYDRFGLYEGSGNCRILFSVEAFYNWATEIDIFDENKRYQGIIDGQIASTKATKFNFYNSLGEHIAIAYLDQNSKNFSLVDPHHPHIILAHLTHHFILGTVDHWEVIMYYPNRLPELLVKIFAAFVCDIQDDFEPDI